MKAILLVGLVLVAGCVGKDEALGYAVRAHPECTSHRVLSHNYGGSREGSSTEVAMQCKETPDAPVIHKSISVKCSFGWGLISDTVCHENN